MSSKGPGNGWQTVARAVGQFRMSRILMPELNDRRKAIVGIGVWVWVRYCDSWLTEDERFCDDRAWPDLTLDRAGILSLAYDKRRSHVALISVTSMPLEDGTSTTFSICSGFRFCQYPPDYTRQSSDWPDETIQMY
jgi:hypothetical protein